MVDRETGHLSMNVKVHYDDMVRIPKYSIHLISLSLLPSDGSVSERTIITSPTLKAPHLGEIKINEMILYISAI
jgi:hypothetical protein